MCCYILCCSTVAIGLPGDASDCNLDKRSAIAAYAKQGFCRLRQQWELGERFWLFGPHWSSCQKLKMMQCALFYCQFWKQKISTRCFPFCQHCHLTWENWAKFFRGCVLTLHRRKLTWNCATISSLIPLVNPSSKLIAKNLIVN